MSDKTKEQLLATAEAWTRNYDAGISTGSSLDTRCLIADLLSLLDSQAAGVTPHGEMTLAEEVLWRREREGQMLKSMAAQGRWIESLQIQLNHAATAMRTACVEKVKKMRGQWHDQYVTAPSNSSPALVAKEMLFAKCRAASDIATALESLQEEQEKHGREDR